MNKGKVIVIGAGMAGCFIAYCLAKQGYDIDIFEYRPDVRKHPFDSGRSFNLTLYYRGIEAMKKAGVWNAVKEIAVIAEGNVAHYSDQKAVFDKFDGASNELLYTVHRNQLNGALLNCLERFAKVTIHFNTRCVKIDVENKTVFVQKEGKTEAQAVKADFVIGADGIHSVVRQTIQDLSQGMYSQDAEDWGYKEVHVSPEKTEQLKLRANATHTWPRNNSLLIAFPNPDTSFTLMFNLPLEGENSFDTLQTKEAVYNYINKFFPDLSPLLKEITQSFLTKPIGKFVTVHTEPWFYQDFLVLVGDAAHAVIPFYGQGVCAAFDDCLVLAEMLEHNHQNLETIFSKYQEKRKRNTDVLADLSKENFIELRDKSRSKFYILKDKADTLLHFLFPVLWLPPLYILIAHGTMDYADAFQKYQKQQQLQKKFGYDFMIRLLAKPWSLAENKAVMKSP